MSYESNSNSNKEILRMLHEVTNSIIVETIFLYYVKYGYTSFWITLFYYLIKYYEIKFNAKINHNNILF